MMVASHGWRAIIMATGSIPANRKRVPEFTCTGVRKVEAAGRHMVRLYISIERDGVWDDQCTVLIAVDDIQPTAEFVTRSVREIVTETNGAVVVAH